MDINQRIKQIRKDKNLSQTEFGKKLGVTRGVINNLDRNEVEAKPHFIKHLCEMFSVNEEWLRTGIGGRYTETEETFISNLAKKFEVDDLLKNMIFAYLKLDKDEKAAVKKYIEEIVNPKPEIKTLTDEEDAEKYANMAREQRLLEKNTKGKAFSAKESDAV